MRYKFHTKIIQSTNLFDKDGKEIFEGTILEMEGESDNGLEFRSGYPVYGHVYNNEGCWRLKVYEDGRLINDEYSLKEALDDDTSRVVGHILSNPELLEG